MIESINHQDKLLAIIIRHDYHEDGIKFVTPDGAILQVGYMSHPAGHKIKPHVHQSFERITLDTQEVIFIKSGKVCVNFYSNEKVFLKSRVLIKGDWVILMNGGHGFDVLEPSIMIEVKNGPYAGDKDKIRF